MVIIMKLQDIGFYTLSDERALNSSISTPLWRTELLLTHRCNFKCPYCRGLRSDCNGDVSCEKAKGVVQYWVDEGLKNVRFSGGEPTLWDGLIDLVDLCNINDVERIAISTNGSASREYYDDLVDAGVNDFSISLDGCCSAVGELMSGGAKCWDRIIDNITHLSKKTYVNIGMVFTEENIKDCIDMVLFADSLGVSDIGVIPSAQYNKALRKLIKIKKKVLDKYPILRYRINNVKRGNHVRGISANNKCHCWLAIDDMAVAGGSGKMMHFPCIIHLREGGDPIGEVCETTRQDREKWILNHNPWEDPICKKNCLDVCVDHNKKASENKIMEEVVL